MHTTITTRLGATCECFGALEEDSNFELICEREEDDTVWLYGNTKTDKSFKTWQEAADFFEELFSMWIVEIHAV
jgi:hypothetical protein